MKKVLSIFMSFIMIIFILPHNTESTIGAIKTDDFIGASLAISRKTITLNEANNAQLITLSAKSTNNTKFDYTGIHVDFDSRLELVPFEVDGKKVPAKNSQKYTALKAVEDGDHGIFMTFTNTEPITASASGTPLWEFQLKIKDAPQDGDTYYIKVEYVDGDVFYLKNSAESDSMTYYAFSHVENGYIKIDNGKQSNVSLGDIDNNSVINAIDASIVLSYYAMVSTNKDGGFNENQKLAADVNSNGVINAVDASYILSYYAYTSTGGTIGFREYLNNQNINNPPQTTTTILQTTKATTTTTTSVVNSTTTTKITPPVTTTTNIDSFKVYTHNNQNYVSYSETKYYSDYQRNKLHGSTMRIESKNISIVYNENKTQAEVRITAEMIHQVDNCPGYIGYRITNKASAIIETGNIKCEHMSVGDKILKTITIKGTPGEIYHVQFYDRFTD